MEDNKENKSAKKKRKPSSANVEDDELHAKIVMSKTNRNVNARDLYKAQKQKLKCVTVCKNDSIWIDEKSTSQDKRSSVSSKWID